MIKMETDSFFRPLDGVRTAVVQPIIISTIAGTGSASYNGDGIYATSAALNYPYGIAFDSFDDLYISESNNNRVRKVAMTSGIISTYAGTGIASYSGDRGRATSAGLSRPHGVAIDSSNNLFIADHDNHLVRRVDYSSKVITTVAGTGTAGFFGDGSAATSAMLNFPISVIIDWGSSYLYIADRNNNRIRKVSLSTNIITTFTGTGSTAASGDGGPATSATIFWPNQMTFDRNGNMYVAEWGGRRVRKIEASTDVITTTAGAGFTGYNGDGFAATSATLTSPQGAHVNRLDGLLYIGDTGNCRLRRVLSDGTISTVAGTGTCSYSGEGVEATSASVSKVGEVASNSKGDVYFADSESSHRVRRLSMGYGTPSAAPTSAPSTAPTTVPTTPTPVPSKMPTAIPSRRPSKLPSETPSLAPTLMPTELPTVLPSVAPTAETSPQPSEGPQPPARPQPSGRPSSAPSSMPTRLDLRTASIFSHPSKELMIFKIDYFLGVYSAFFAALFILLLALDKFKWKKGAKLSEVLVASSYRSSKHRNSVTEGDSSGGALRGLLLWRIIADEESAAAERRAQDMESSVAAGKGYDSDFYRYLLGRRTYLGCEPLCFPTGCNFYFFKVTTRGLLEDALIYIHNYHKIASCVYAIKGSPYSRTSRRIVFMMQHILTFSLLVTSIDFLGRSYGELSLRTQLVQITAIPTFSIFASIVFRVIITSNTIRKIGRTSTSCIFMLWGSALLTFAAMSSSAGSRFALIGEYTLKVFVISALQDILLILLLFYHRMYFALYIKRFPVLCIGKYYVEKLLHSNLSSASSKDLVAVSRSLGFLTVEWACDNKGTLGAAAAAVEAGRIDFTENPLLQRREAVGNAARLSTGSVANSATAAPPPPPPPPPPLVVYAQNTSVAQAAHSVSQKKRANPLKPSTPTVSARTRAVGSIVLEEEGADVPAGGLYDASTSGDYEVGDDERLRVNFTRFGDAVSRVFADKVHFFQARESGATDAANVDDIDLSALAVDEVPTEVTGAVAGIYKQKSVFEISLMFDKAKAASFREREARKPDV